MYRYKSDTAEQGQATIALVGVIVMLGVAAIAVAWIGEAVVHRARARAAADAIALAVAIDVDDGDALAWWYRDHAMVVEQRDNQTMVRSGPSQSLARADVVTTDTRASPVVRAIVARAEQLTGQPFASARSSTHSLSLSIDDGRIFARIAIEFGMCPTVETTTPANQTSFTWC